MGLKSLTHSSGRDQVSLHKPHHRTRPDGALHMKAAVFGEANCVGAEDGYNGVREPLN